MPRDKRICCDCEQGQFSKLSATIDLAYACATICFTIGCIQAGTCLLCFANSIRSLSSSARASLLTIWLSTRSLPTRHNGEEYRGINILMLWVMAAKNGYVSSRWMTYRQAQE